MKKLLVALSIFLTGCTVMAQCRADSGDRCSAYLGNNSVDLDRTWEGIRNTSNSHVYIRCPVYARYEYAQVDGYWTVIRIAWLRLLFKGSDDQVGCGVVETDESGNLAGHHLINSYWNNAEDEHFIEVSASETSLMLYCLLPPNKTLVRY